jgi:hypothetical protein
MFTRKKLHVSKSEELHGGFGELAEDHLEQSHQHLDNIHRRLRRLGFGAK